MRSVMTGVKATSERSPRRRDHIHRALRTPPSSVSLRRAEGDSDRRDASGGWPIGSTLDHPAEDHASGRVPAPSRRTRIHDQRARPRRAGPKIWLPFWVRHSSKRKP